jgi:hypothetical protein
LYPTLSHLTLWLTLPTNLNCLRICCPTRLYTPLTSFENCLYHHLLTRLQGLCVWHILETWQSRTVTRAWDSCQVPKICHTHRDSCKSSSFTLVSPRVWILASGTYLASGM